MKGTHLGEFEELVLLIVGILYPDAYGLAIMHEIKEQAKRSAAMGAVHAALSRLEEKGFLTSRLDDATSERGGRRKKLYKLTASGKEAIAYNRSLRSSLWDKIPDLTWNTI